MRLALDTFIALQKALPGTMIDPEDARPFLLPVVSNVISIPKILVPTTSSPTGTRSGSLYFSRRVAQASASPITAVDLTTLTSGLWRISGSIFTTADNPVSLNDSEQLYLTQNNLRQSFSMVPRVNSTTDTARPHDHFDFNVVLREDGAIGILFDATGAGLDVNAFISIRAEKFL